MKNQRKNHSILKITLMALALMFIMSGCERTLNNSIAKETKGSDPNRYLDAVRQFADNVLEYGRDTYGPKHTPLFVDGLNIHTHEPVKWRYDGQVWILSNLASQQNFFRTLDGLSTITGDPKYKQASMEAIEYGFNNLRSPNGLLHWGGHVAYNAQTDEMCMCEEKGYNHELKFHFPYYELMWEVNPNATRSFIEAFWSAHILDWSNLTMNRHGSMTRHVEEPWGQEYKGGPVFFESTGLSFLNTGSDLFYAAAMLSELSGKKESLVWAKRLAYRYVETRNPKTGIGGSQYTRLRSDRAELQFGDDFKGHLVLEGTLFPGGLRHSATLAAHMRAKICQILLADLLGAQGKEFHQWALDELTAWVKIAYRKKDNSFIPMLTDGTSLEGYIYTKDGYFGPKGTIVKPMPTPLIAFWVYALTYRLTGDDFIWEMTRNIARGNNLGDIGVSPKDNPDLRKETNCSDPYALLGFLEIYKKTGKKTCVEMAQRIGDNILANRFHKGFFVPSKEALYTKFDYIEPLVLLHLDAVVNAKPSSVPQVWPSRSFFACTYDAHEREEDTIVVYGQTKATELTSLLHEAVWDGKIDEVESLLSKGADVNGGAKVDSLMVQRILGMSSALDTGLKSALACSTTALHYAAGQGHKEIVELLIDNDAGVNAINTDGDSPLHFAVGAGHKDIVELLIENDADINIENNNGQTPFDIALSLNRREILELLQSQGATITSIHAAAQIGNLARVRAFLEEGTDINAKDKNGQTALHIVVTNDYNDIAELLIDQGADVNATDQYNYTPLYYAIFNINKNIVSLLVDKGADVNLTSEEDYTPLHFAVWIGDLDIVKLLVDKGAKFDVKALEDWTAFRYAALQGSRDMVELFISKGADASGLHVAAFMGDLDRVKELIEKGTEVDTRDEAGWTALFWAACAGQTEVAELLIDNSADLSATDSIDGSGKSLLHQAAQAGSAQLVELLISRGGDVNAKNRGGVTPLHSACQQGNKEIVEVLIANGADVNATAMAGQTPLMYAARYGYQDVAEFLIDKGADVNAQDNQGRTLLDWASRMGHTEIVELLREHGVKE